MQVLNAVAQELHAHGLGTRFFRNRTQGEIDFVIAGKDYHRHSALSNVLATPNYGINRAIVLCEDNVSQEGRIEYLPAYFAALLGQPRGE